MSWNFEVRGDNREQVMTNVYAEAKRYETYCDVARVMDVAAVAARSMPDAAIKSLKTHGHMNEDGSGNFSLSINC